MIRIKLCELHLESAKMLKEAVKYERNKRSERGDQKRKHHHIQLKKSGGPAKNFYHVWLNLPERDINGNSNEGHQ